jgi:16S rRNA (uracil1498-N3)-methyltransferase
MHRFYSEDLEANTKELILNEFESNHACRVLRLKAGDTVELVNGRGFFALATIVQPHHKRCLLEINRIEFTEADEKRIHIAICPTKSNDRFEWFLEKAVEIGVDEITPLISENSERYKLNFERLEKIILSALKQSMRAYKPVLNPSIHVKEFIRLHREALIAHCDKQFQRFEIQRSKPSTYTIMIGPEGDFSKSEIELALKHNLKSVSLGNNRLRTETAGLVAITLLNATRT